MFLFILSMKIFHFNLSWLLGYIFLASLLLYFSFKHWYLLVVAYMLRPLIFLIYTLTLKGLLYFAGFNYDLHDGESQIHITADISPGLSPLTVSTHLKPNLVRKLESLMNVVFFYVVSCSMDQQISSHPIETGTQSRFQLYSSYHV